MKATSRKTKRPDEKEIMENDMSSFLASIVQSSEDAIISKTINGIVTSWNPASEKIFGYSADEMIGQPITKIIPEDRLNEEPDILERIKKGEVVNHFETLRINKEGKLLNISLTISPIKNREGKITGASKIARDITEQIATRLKIEESEQRYNLLIHSSPSAIGILYGEDLVITVANDTIIKIWGKGKDIIGKKYFEALPELAEQGYKEVFVQVYKTGNPFNAIETPVNILQDGVMTLKYYNFLLYALRNINNEIDGIGIIATEVSSQAEYNLQLKESEERFRSLADNMPLNVFIIEPTREGNISYWNKYWLDYTGQTMEEALGRTLDGIIHPDDVQPIMDAYRLAFEARQPFYLQGIRIRRFDGQYRWFAVQASPRYLPNGEFKGFIGVGFDIHQQKMVEKDLTEAKVLAENAVRFKQQFLSNMSHEIRTPLNSILGFTNVLLKTVLDEEQKEFVQAIKTSGKSLNVLINDILDLAKVDAGKMTFENHL